MCKSYQITKTEIQRILEEERCFTYSELCNSILLRGGVLRVGEDYSITQYLRKLETTGLIFFNEYLNKYEVASVEELA